MKFAIAVFVAILATGALAIAWSWSYSFTACAVEEYDEFVKLAVDHYSNTVERLLTLSTALVALGSAVLLGFQKAPKITGTRRVLTLASTSCFVLSAYFALLWQSWLAQVLFLECPKLIAEPVMQFPFYAGSYFFVTGLILIALVVLLAAFDAPSEMVNDDEPTAL